MKTQKIVWMGRILSALVVLPFAFSAAAKLFPEALYPKMHQEMVAIGLPESILPTVATLEILCIVTYLIPATSVLGAVLFTGYLGGAMLTHLRAGEPVVMHIVLGTVIWLGLYLREPRLHALLPFRRKACQSPQ